MFRNVCVRECLIWWWLLWKKCDAKLLQRYCCYCWCILLFFSFFLFCYFFVEILMRWDFSLVFFRFTLCLIQWWRCNEVKWIIIHWTRRRNTISAIWYKWRSLGRANIENSLKGYYQGFNKMYPSAGINAAVAAARHPVSIIIYFINTLPSRGHVVSIVSSIESSSCVK